MSERKLSVRDRQRFEEIWASGFLACLYLFCDRHADYERERDAMLKGRAALSKDNSDG